MRTILIIIMLSISVIVLADHAKILVSELCSHLFG